MLTTTTTKRKDKCREKFDGNFCNEISANVRFFLFHQYHEHDTHTRSIRLIFYYCQSITISYACDATAIVRCNKPSPKRNGASDIAILLPWSMKYLFCRWRFVRFSCDVPFAISNGSSHFCLIAFRRRDASWLIRHCVRWSCTNTSEHTHTNNKVTMSSECFNIFHFM